MSQAIITPTRSPSRLYAVAGALACVLALAAALALGGSGAASAQESPALTVLSARLTVHQEVDWSNVPRAPASPAQTVAAYDR